MTNITMAFKVCKRLMLFSLSLSLILAACGKKDTVVPADKSALAALITQTQALYDGSVEGTKPGQYESGAKAALLAILNNAKSVYADAGAMQSSVTNASAQLAAAVVTFQTHLVKEIASENLIGFWKFNGNAKDSSGKGNDGTLMAGHAYFGAGTPTLTADRFGRANMAYHFDKGGNIEVPFTAALNPPQFSISIWFKKSVDGRTVNTDTYTMTSLNRWNGYKFQLQSTNKLFLTVKGANNSDTTYYDRDDNSFAANNDVWYHAIVTYKAGEMTFYVNGDPVKTWNDVPLNPITLQNPPNFVIGQDLPTSKYTTTDDGTGRFFVNWGGFWTGDLDDVMFYNVALTAQQVKSIYTNQNTL